MNLGDRIIDRIAQREKRLPQEAQPKVPDQLQIPAPPLPASDLRTLARTRLNPLIKAIDAEGVMEELRVFWELEKPTPDIRDFPYSPPNGTTIRMELHGFPNRTSGTSAYIPYPALELKLSHRFSTSTWEDTVRSEIDPSYKPGAGADDYHNWPQILVPDKNYQSGRCIVEAKIQVYTDPKEPIIGIQEIPLFRTTYSTRSTEYGPRDFEHANDPVAFSISDPISARELLVRDLVILLSEPQTDHSTFPGPSQMCPSPKELRDRWIKTDPQI